MGNGGVIAGLRSQQAIARVLPEDFGIADFLLVGFATRYTALVMLLFVIVSIQESQAPAFLSYTDRIARSGRTSCCWSRAS